MNVNRTLLSLACLSVSLLVGCGGPESAPKAGGGVANTTARSLPGKPVVVMETSKGPVVIELYPDKAPITVKNFLDYVDAGFYDGTIFHRVIPDFMIQGGGFTPNMQEKRTRDPIQNESGNGLSNTIGTLAMARTNNPHSATAQFFINVNDNSRLDNQCGGYCVFGKVIDGLDVVHKIRTVPTDSIGGHENVPVEAVIIQSVRRAPE
ncbi:MAG: peptidyl-prolyl cis-trans isomerase [Planctomycetia bacterium]|nr:peptidyl-prolyl cis-trans isomerase [Planctomycetia bacterium]